MEHHYRLCSLFLFLSCDHVLIRRQIMSQFFLNCSSWECQKTHLRVLPWSSLARWMRWYVSKQHILRNVLSYTWFITVVRTPEAEKKKRGLQNQASYLKCQGCWGKNTLVQKTHNSSSNDNRFRSCESLFFPLNNGMLHLIPSFDRNGID
jgi:hypothetical protein